MHHGVRAQEKGREAKTIWRADGYKRGGIIGNIMIYGW
jgi:hypothetical protein